jgi:hypothetical protein
MNFFFIKDSINSKIYLFFKKKLIIIIIINTMPTKFTLICIILTLTGSCLLMNETATIYHERGYCCYEKVKKIIQQLT